jgi:hypothetical protein
MKQRKLSHLVLVFTDGSEITLEKEAIESIIAAKRVLNLLEAGATMAELVKGTL